MGWRVAYVTSERSDLETVERYMPGCYAAVPALDGSIVIVGQDESGWTLDDYVLPRLASGLHFGTEVDWEG